MNEEPHFIVSNIKVIFTEKDIPMLKEALQSLRIQARLSKKSIKTEVKGE